MKYNPDIHRRRSVRLAGYDYSQAGAYFVTICAQNRECLFGDIIDGEMRLNGAGCMAEQCWNDVPDHFSDVKLDEFIIMPNHVHGIIAICHNDCRGEVSSPSSVAVTPGLKMKQGGETPPLQRHALGKIVAYFKYQSAKQINQIRNTPGCPVWQRNYYEHIIRNEQSLQKIRQYIIDNPVKWADDEDNPSNIVIYRRGMACHAPATP